MKIITEMLQGYNKKFYQVCLLGAIICNIKISNKIIVNNYVCFMTHNIENLFNIRCEDHH